MDMESNMNEPMSLRAWGAFTSPSIMLEWERIPVLDDYEKLAEKLLDIVEKVSDNFIDKYDLDEYVLNEYDCGDADALKCLAYINTDQLELAKKLAIENIHRGDAGGFKSSGKTFFEHVLLYEY